MGHWTCESGRDGFVIRYRNVAVFRAETTQHFTFPELGRLVKKLRDHLNTRNCLKCSKSFLPDAIDDKICVPCNKKNTKQPSILTRTGNGQRHVNHRSTRNI